MCLSKARNLFVFSCLYVFDACYSLFFLAFARKGGGWVHSYVPVLSQEPLSEPLFVYILYLSKCSFCQNEVFRWISLGLVLIYSPLFLTCLGPYLCRYRTVMPFVQCWRLLGDLYMRLCIFCVFVDSCLMDIYPHLCITHLDMQG